MAQANMLTAELLSTICNEATYTHGRVKRYTVGGTQIGFSGLGQGDELLTFPSHYLMGEALESHYWVRLSTNHELVADLCRKCGDIDVAEKPHFFFFEDGSRAYECQRTGLRRFVVYAVATETYMPAPIIERPCHAMISKASGLLLHQAEPDPR